MNYGSITWRCCSIVTTLVLMMVACTTSSSPDSMPLSFTPTLTVELSTPTATTTSALPTATSSAPPTSPTPTTNFAPTLTSGQESEFVVSMLQTNGGCELPCWWGITPGHTSYWVMRNSFYSQGVPMFSGNEYESLSFSIPDPDPELADYIGFVRFEIEDQVVHSIQVSSETILSWIDPPERFAQDWRLYSWDEVMNQYGVPSQVFFGIERHGDPGQAIYFIGLLYEPIGVAIRYMGMTSLDTDASVVQACPDFSKIAVINLFLVPSDDSVTEHLLSLSHASNLGPSLEEVTGMSVEEFYEDFRDPDSDVCLEQQAPP